MPEAPACPRLQGIPETSSRKASRAGGNTEAGSSPVCGPQTFLFYPGVFEA